MDYTIHSFGGGEILWKVLNSLAILFKNDSQYFTPVVKLSLGIGGFWAALTAIYKHQVGVFARDWFIPAFLVLNLLFVPKATLNIIDHVDDRFHAVQVSDLPLGLVLVASLPSGLFYHLSVLVEKNMMPEKDVFRYTKTGPMFAAQLIHASRDIRISDPIMLQNMKSFVKQCFYWPYVITNIDPGTKAARETSDILKFIEDNPHPSLGMYWQESGAETTFKFCRACSEKVRTIIDVMAKDGLLQLSANVNRSQEVLEQYLPDAWSEVATHATHAHDIVGQQMVINASRESFDDLREFHRLKRLHPRLTSYSATRAWEGQNQGFLINGILASRHLPMLQNVVFVTLVMMFLLVIPMVFFPGGIGILNIWIKMMFWVTSWPLFFCILNTLGSLWLLRSTGLQGLSLQTQMGLADHAFDAYALFQGMCWMVPLLSWAFISKGGYALVQTISGLTANLGHSLGQNIADNTQTFDVQAFHNRNAECFTIAQQTFSPSFLAGTRVNDGSLERTISASGAETYQQNMTTLRQNFSMQGSLSDAAAQNKAYEEGVSHSLQASLSEASAQSLQKASDVVEQWGKSTATVEGFSEAENREIKDSFARAVNTAQQMSDKDQMTNTGELTGSLKGGVGIPGTSAVGGFLKKFGLDIGADVAYKKTAMDQSIFSQDKSHGFTESDAHNIAKGLNAAHDNRVTFGSDTSQKASDSLRESMDKSKSFQDQIAASHQRQQRYAETVTATQNVSGGFTANINDDLLSYIGNAKFLGDKHAAMQWAMHNPTAFQNEGHRYVQGYLRHTQDWLKDSGRTTIDPEMLGITYGQYKEQLVIRKPILGEDYSAQQERERLGVKDGFATQQETINLKQRVAEMTNQEMPHVTENKALQERFEERKSTWKAKRLVQ